ncbi:Uu.00g064900.m01.CDS01 [Anthostomella pinea]|uniref:Uu.00g064900.m01.CDS01 n=1 Tax=Anthostomella pinea TaxID=933095 RepID=A0AAI8YN65_9PEZI|nr:Uu.00g064900.m01.CDS01 [Anthostomella pinea]
MPTTYGEVSQSDNDDDGTGRPSPSASLSPALSSSPMPFLSAVKSTFTPLSMDSETYSTSIAMDDGSIPSRDSHERVAETAIAAAKTGSRATPSVGEMAQSLSAARATKPDDYHLLSPGDAPSPTSSSPTSTDTGLRPVSGPSPYSEAGRQRNFASIPPHNDSPKSPTSRPQHPQHSTELSSEEPLQPQAVQTLVIVKPKPIVRTASTKSVSLRHPAPDSNPRTRNSSHASNIAQLEATAEQLSMTSSIEDAIRDLHDEQKRNESRRSSILAASISSIYETNEPVTFPMSRQISAASSILETNSAARYGGYSPAGYVMSPNNSLLSSATRIRSGSGSTGHPRPEPDVDTLVTRHGPGKSSIRSARSVSKPTLMKIAEMEPTSLTSAAMDEADKLAEEPEEEETLRIPHMKNVDLTPKAGEYTPNGYDYWDHAVAEQQYKHNYQDERPRTAGSDGTYEQAERAFADFDGAHCSPHGELEESLNFETLFASPTTESFLPSFNPEGPINTPEPESSRPVMARPVYPPTVRPKSYLDPATGENMMFYPARVPMMLNLPLKLSKKPKAEVRNNRRSQVLSSMPEANRQSWLPEYMPEPLMDPLGPISNASAPQLPADASMEPADASKEPATQPLLDERSDSQLQVRPDPQPLDREARNSRMSVLGPDKRKSRLDLAGLPPQLRASAFFDLPSESSPAIQLKDGSAMATLDSILDASAKAPVTAFTDHAFAGTLGSETYGAGNKRKSHMKRASATDLLVPKKRNSFFHLRKLSNLSRHSNSQDERRDTVVGAGTASSVKRSDELDEQSQHLAGSVDGEQAPDDDGEEQNEDEFLYDDGAPTTLLAELQKRKQQNKLRTRPITTAYPNGMHSTLLAMDTVAEMERKARKGKKINLAWEDPNTKQDDESDDEDTPLGLLMAAKSQNTGLIGAMAELNRPPGLMEQRDMEDNEPLSARRNRLQGREAGPVKRMTLARGLKMSGALGSSSPQLRVDTPEEDEVEGETLGERMRRLRAREEGGENALPQTRPVSTAFSVEMLSQLGDAFKEDTDDQDKGKGKAIAQPTEEEETLGQRRRRLQAEREAKERELSSGRLSVTPKLTKRHSLADVLGATRSRTVLSDPRLDAEKAKQAEAALYKRSQEQKLAALRPHMPSNLSAPNINRSGGYMSGQFNDGGAGRLGHPRHSMAMSGFGGSQGLPTPGIYASNMGNAYGAGDVMSSYGMPTPMANPYGMQMQPAGQMDRVERWRQGIYP